MGQEVLSNVIKQVAQWHLFKTQLEQYLIPMILRNQKSQLLKQILETLKKKIWDQAVEMQHQTMIIRKIWNSKVLLKTKGNQALQLKVIMIIFVKL